MKVCEKWSKRSPFTQKIKILSYIIKKRVTFAFPKGHQGVTKGDLWGQKGDLLKIENMKLLGIF